MIRDIGGEYLTKSIGQVFFDALVTCGLRSKRRLKIFNLTKQRTSHYTYTHIFTQ